MSDDRGRASDGNSDFFALSPDLLCIAGLDGYFRRVNPAWTRILGFEAPELCARPWREFVHPEDRERTAPEVREFETRFLCKNGAYRWLAWNTLPLAPEGVVYCVVHDITERKTAERRLTTQFAVNHVLAEGTSLAAAASDLLQAICEAEGWLVGAMWHVDDAQNVLRCGELWHAHGTRVERFAAVSRAMVFEQGVGLPGRVWQSGRPAWIPDVVKDENFPRASVAAHDRLHAACAFPILRGTEVRGVLEFFSDEVRPPDSNLLESMTHIGSQIGQFVERERAQEALKRAEARLIEADRIAALGTLAAGVAHEINNPLTYVRLNLDLLSRELASDAHASGHGFRLGNLLRAARDGVDRVVVIVQDLKSFSRVHDEKLQPVDLLRVLDSTIHMAAAEIRHRARLERDYGPVPTVLGNEARLGQVFLNLLLNAAQAIVEGDADENLVTVRARSDASGAAVVEICDSGPGMSSEVLARIFDPFFTTKPVGVGTGLGLFICHGIVNALGGSIAVDSEPGYGTIVRVTLPPSSERPDAAPASPPGSGETIAKRAARARVLVIDDEPTLADAVRMSLADQFDVRVVASGRAALELLEHDRDYDVIVCDLLMPELTGMDVHERIVESHPLLAERMIFMTGGAFTARAREFLTTVSNPCLDKPFPLSQLVALVEERTLQR